MNDIHKLLAEAGRKGLDAWVTSGVDHSIIATTVLDILGIKITGIEQLVDSAWSRPTGKWRPELRQEWLT